LHLAYCNLVKIHSPAASAIDQNKNEVHNATCFLWGANHEARTMANQRWMRHPIWHGDISPGGLLQHGTRAIGASDAKPTLIAEMKTLWLIFSLQLIILSVLAFSASRCASARQLILLCSLMPLLDMLLCLKFMGMFPGIILLTIVCLFFWAGAYFLPGPT
jgi:hypothetical protein